MPASVLRRLALPLEPRPVQPLVAEPSFHQTLECPVRRDLEKQYLWL